MSFNNENIDEAYTIYKDAMESVLYIERRINRIGKEEQHKLTFEMSGAAIPKIVGRKTIQKNRLEKLKAKALDKLDLLLDDYFLKNGLSKEVQWNLKESLQLRYTKEGAKELEASQELAFEELQKRKDNSIKRTDDKTLYQSQESANYLLNQRKEEQKNNEKKSEINNASKTKDETASYNFSLEFGLDKFDKMSNDKAVSEKDYNYSLELNFDKFDNTIKDKPIFEKDTDKDNLSAMPNNTGNYNFSIDIGFDSMSETIEVSNPDKAIDKGFDMDR